MSDFEKDTPTRDENAEENKKDLYKSRAQYDPTAENREEVDESFYEDITKSTSAAKLTFRQRLENFFYHYKWHSIIAAFLVIVIVVGSVQMCDRTTYDMYVMYAGGDDIRMNAPGGEETEYEKLLSATRRFVSDFDGDGERNITMLNLFLPSDDRIKEIEAMGPEYEISHSLLSENDGIFRENLYYGEYYICILSEHLLVEWTKEGKNNPFLPISDYLPEDAPVITGSLADAKEGEYVLKNSYGVYLKSTPIADNPGYELLGDDTVICMRMLTEANNHMSKKKNREHFKNSEEVLRLMLADKAYE